MGKRSNFERHARDYYRTPLAAVAPLKGHIPVGSTYIEPCAGDGCLIGHLEASLDLLTCGAFDIEPQSKFVKRADALNTWRLSDAYIKGCDYIITNPPWDRKILHPMIAHFSAKLPTWLLFDADWMHTKQSAPYMPWLRRVVSVGRVKWIPDSKMTGKDNCAWYLFDQAFHGSTEFIGRAA